MLIFFISQLNADYVVKGDYGENLFQRALATENWPFEKKKITFEIII